MSQRTVRSSRTFVTLLATLAAVLTLSFVGSCGGGDAQCSGNMACQCNAGEMCEFDCPGGGCTFECQAGATCDFDCSGGGCAANCQAGSTCDLICDEGCSVNCVGADCNVTCDALDGCACAGC